MTDKLQILIDEITVDPNTVGYSGMTDEQVAAELNAVNKQRGRSIMSGKEILDNIEASALASLTGDHAVKVMGVIGVEGGVDPFGPGVQIFIDAFGAGSATIIALNAARVETVSRATILGLGHVRPADITEARS